MKPKRDRKLEEVRRLEITVGWHTRLNRSEKSGRRGKCDYRRDRSETSGNTCKSTYTTVYNVVKAGKHTVSSIAYQSANGRTLWCLSKLPIYLPFNNPTSGNIPTYVRKIKKSRYEGYSLHHCL